MGNLERCNVCLVLNSWVLKKLRLKCKKLHSSLGYHLLKRFFFLTNTALPTRKAILIKSNLEFHAFNILNVRVPHGFCQIFEVLYEAIHFKISAPMHI